MIEVKERDLKCWHMNGHDLETLSAFEAQRKVSFRLDRNEEEDEPIVNTDGTVSFVRTVNVNGVQWRIPVDQHTNLPEGIYNILKQSEDIKNQYRPKPVNIVRIDIGYG